MKCKPLEIKWICLSRLQMETNVIYIYRYTLNMLLQVEMWLIDSAHWSIGATLACLTSESANKWPHKKREPVWKNPERSVRTAAGEVWARHRFSVTPLTLAHSQTQRRRLVTISKYAAFQQLHVLHEEHPPSSIRAGAVWLHHGERCQVYTGQIFYIVQCVVVFQVVCVDFV